MSIVFPVIGGVRPTGLFFWSDVIVLCSRHTRRIALQPVTDHDQERGFGTSDCPFCSNGPLHGQYHKFRSNKALKRALESLERS